jgi:hypothetical protein
MFGTYCLQQHVSLFINCVMIRVRLMSVYVHTCRPARSSEKALRLCCLC